MKKIQISIPTPCHENWENMTPVEKGRFCNSCQKQVVDFSSMSDREIAAFFKKPSAGSTCGRFLEGQMNRDIEIPRKRIPWVKYFFQFALPAFLVSLKASAQKERQLMRKVAPVEVRTLLGDTTTQVRNELIVEDSIKGKIVDSEGKPIPFATVVIKGTNIGTQGNLSGEFILHAKKATKEIILLTSAVGYMTQESKLSNKPDLINKPIILKLENQIAGEVVVVGGYVTGKRKKTKKKDTISAASKIQEIKKFEDNTLKSFNVYPNPIQSGSSLNIEWKKSGTGYFVLQLFNQQGQMILNKELWIDDKATGLNFELPHVAAGNYIVRMTSKQTGEAFSEKIIIQ
ncbi:MAG TPA: carboxypeptidase-like regulatory domain-containing protein [Chitinophagaceae bacterium]|nr:carboxypeptidase-like regulatory domain-containing protein [Chitinophagaceae bacterium]